MTVSAHHLVALRQLAAHLRSGRSLAGALTAVASALPNGPIQAHYHEAALAASDGIESSEAIAMALPEAMRGALRGVAIADLPAQLGRVADAIAAQARTASQIRAVTAYPTWVGMACAVLLLAGLGGVFLLRGLTADVMYSTGVETAVGVVFAVLLVAVGITAVGSRRRTGVPLMLSQLPGSRGGRWSEEAAFLTTFDALASAPGCSLADAFAEASRSVVDDRLRGELRTHSSVLQNDPTRLPWVLRQTPLSLSTRVAIATYGSGDGGPLRELVEQLRDAAENASARFVAALGWLAMFVAGLVVLSLFLLFFKGFVLDMVTVDSW